MSVLSRVLRTAAMAALVSFSVAVVTSDAAYADENETVGKAATPFDLRDINSQKVQLESLRGKVILLSFWATWCGPCKLISKVVEKAAPEFKGNLKIVKIETDPNPILVEKYEVYGLPTLMVFKDGQPVKGSKREGAINLAKLKDYLQSHGISPA